MRDLQRKFNRLDSLRHRGLKQAFRKVLVGIHGHDQIHGQKVAKPLDHNEFELQRWKRSSCSFCSGAREINLPPRALDFILAYLQVLDMVFGKQLEMNKSERQLAHLLNGMAHQWSSVTTS